MIIWFSGEQCSESQNEGIPFKNIENGKKWHGNRLEGHLYRVCYYGH